MKTIVAFVVSYSLIGIGCATFMVFHTSKTKQVEPIPKPVPKTKVIYPDVTVTPDLCDWSIDGLEKIVSAETKEMAKKFSKKTGCRDHGSRP